MPVGFDTRRQIKHGQTTQLASIKRTLRWWQWKFNFLFRVHFNFAHVRHMFPVHVSAKTTSKPHLCHRLHHFADSNPPINFHILLLQVSLIYVIRDEFLHRLATVSITLSESTASATTANRRNLIIMNGAVTDVCFLCANDPLWAVTWRRSFGEFHYHKYDLRFPISKLPSMRIHKSEWIMNG